MHFVTLRIYSHGLADVVLEQSIMVDHLEKLERLEQTFDISVPGSEQTDTVTLQLEFDPPLNLSADDEEDPPSISK